jgi:hypothetical protein
MNRRLTIASVLGLIALSLGCAASASAQGATPKLGPRPLQPPASSATAPMPVAELAKQSDIIAAGRVTGFRSEWNPAHTRVFPCAVLSTSEYMKASQTGVSGANIAIVYQESGPGMVRFQRDEEILVFLKRDADGNLQVLGGTQGKYVITKDVRTAVKMVSAYTTLEQMKAQITAALRTGVPQQ